MTPTTPTTAILASLPVPVVQAPMAGGPSTPELSAAVNRGGGLGFVAGGYLDPGRLRENIEATRRLTDKPFGVNVFAAQPRPADPAVVVAYAHRLAAEAQLAGVELGRARSDDDALADKLALLTGPDAPAVVSFTFGLPSADHAAALRDAGAEVWLTVTSPAEARAAAALGPDALIVQGIEAGGHRGVLADDERQSQLTLLSALQLIAADVDLPLIAAGAIASGAAVAAALAAGASAAQIGTAYLRSAEADTAPAHRDAVASRDPTVLTRAFSGRTARAIDNRWHRAHGADAPAAYPELHHLTAPLRAHGRRTDDPDLINLWAGETHRLAADAGAEQITRTLGEDARMALAAAARRLG